MDCLNCQALIGILETCRLLSISGYSLQGWAGRRKRLSTASEVSIPARDFFHPLITLEGNPLVFLNHCTRFGSRYDQGKSLYGLPKLNSLMLCYDIQQGWLQRLSTRTETRWTAFEPFSDAIYAFLRLQASIQKQYQWRLRYMDNYVQLELFDLGLYTSEQPTAIDGETEQFEEVPPCVEYEQLELDLFPQPSYVIPKMFVRLAA